MMTKHKNLHIVDIVKFICSILILFLHTEVFKSISPIMSMGFRNTIATIAVPFFFTISGFFFWKKYFNTATKNGTSNILLPTLKRLIFLYLVYSLIYLPFVAIGWIKNGFTINSILTYVYSFFMTGSFSTIWYLLALIVAFVVSYFSYTKLGEKATLIIAGLCYIWSVSFILL